LTDIPLNAQPSVPLFDEGNKLLGELPAQLTTDVIDTAAGQRLVLTVRTPTTTLTVFLRGADAKAWAKQLSSESAVMPDSGLIAANGKVLT
jgi:hypothetical protein